MLRGRQREGATSSLSERRRSSFRGHLARRSRSNTPVRPKQEAKMPLQKVTSNGDESLVLSETMQIMLSVHSLTGIESRQPKRKPIGRKGRQCRFPKDSTPVTAVISASREFVNSMFARQTFLPSAPLVQQTSSKSRDLIKSNAYWRGNGDAFGFEDEESTGMIPSANMQLTRTMKREKYRAGMSIGRVPHFVHERIDLTVGIMKGNHICPLGVASISVSGDEEHEITMNVAVKPRDTSPTRMRKFGPKQGESRNDPVIYSLANNATLTVGVRCVADDILRQPDTAARIVAEQREDTPLWLDLEDTNSLINSKSFFSEQFSERVSLGFSCNSWSCSAKRGVGSPRKLPYRDRTKSSSSFANTKVLSIMSDVSDSTFGTSEDSDNDYDGY